MGEDTREMDALKQKVINGVTMVSPGAVFLLKGFFKLIQYFIRLHKEGKLSKGEVTKYKKFFKSTNGQYTIKNITWNKKEDYLKFKEQLTGARIAFSELPKQNGLNHTQIAVFDRDIQKFEGLFSGYIADQLSGGEKKNKVLRDLTKGRAQIISVPIEDKKFIDETLKPDLNRLKVNYSMMPDLKVGDGYSQLLVAEKDMYSVKEWFEQYRGSLLKRGEPVGEMRKITKEEYQATANMSEDEYIALNPEHKKLSEKYDKDPDLGEALDMQAGKEKPADSPLFKKKYEDPSLAMISVDKKTLVDSDFSCRNLAETSNVTFKCRIPNTHGDDARFLFVIKDNVFIHNPDGERPRYICFIPKNEKPHVVDNLGKKVDIGFNDGLSVTKRFDDAKAFVQKQGMENVVKNLQSIKSVLPSKGGITP